MNRSKRLMGIFLLLLSILSTLSTLQAEDWFESGIEAYKKGAYESALERFSASCQEGNKQGCYNLAVMYKHGQGIRPSRQKSQELFSKACQGEIKGCRFSEIGG